MARTKIVAGNWKMNLDAEAATSLVSGIVKGIKSSKVSVIISPSFVHLEKVSSLIANTDNIALGAQNCHQEAAGAFTGEVATSMLKSVGVKYVLIGHSERRAYFSESYDLLKQKVDRVLATGLCPIFCCGESLEIREKGKHQSLIAEQLEASLFHLDAAIIKQTIIAYEPVWAIGTGVTASPEQAQDMHAFIRGLIGERYGQAVADEVHILYGGSCKPANAQELFSLKDVDGGLIGGASLKEADFCRLVEIAQSL